MSRGRREAMRQALDKRSLALHLASTFCGHGTPLPPAEPPFDDDDEDLDEVPPALIDPPQPDQRIQIGPLDVAGRTNPQL